MTDYAERAELARRFRSGDLKYLVADDLPTAGFEVPNVDCVVLLRPMLSQLHQYLAAQGLRRHPQKSSCLVLDFVGNALRHGPIDQLADGNVFLPKSTRACSGCHLVLAGCDSKCPNCGGTALQPPTRRRTFAMCSDMRQQRGDGICTQYAVHEITYSVHAKQGASSGARKTMRVDYRLESGRRQSEFIPIEHTGYARQMARSSGGVSDRGNRFHQRRTRRGDCQGWWRGPHGADHRRKCGRPKIRPDRRRRGSSCHRIRPRQQYRLTMRRIRPMPRNRLHEAALE